MANIGPGGFPNGFPKGIPIPPMPFLPGRGQMPHMPVMPGRGQMSHLPMPGMAGRGGPLGMAGPRMGAPQGDKKSTTAFLGANVPPPEVYGVVQELLPPTGVTAACFARFVRPDRPDLVVARTNLLQVFEITFGKDGSTGVALIFEKKVFGKVHALACMPAKRPGEECDSLVLTFEDAKVCHAAFDRDVFDFAVRSLHYYENKDLAFGYSRFLHGPEVRVDPRLKCAAVLLYDRSITILSYETQKTFHSDDKNLHSTVVKLPPLGVNRVIDFAFVSGFSEPTVAFLFQKTAAAAGNAKSCPNSCCLAVYSFQPCFSRHTLLWEIDGLPFSCDQLVTVPAPTGGVLVLGPNTIIYCNRNCRKNMALNKFGCEVFAAGGCEYKRSTDSFVLEAVRSAEAISESQIAISTRTTTVYLVTLACEGYDVKDFDVTPWRKAAVPSCMTVDLESSMLFIGSTFTDSFLGMFRILGHTSRAPAAKKAKTGDKMEDEYEEFFGTSTLKRSKTVAPPPELREILRLRSLGTIKDIAVDTTSAQQQAKFGNDTAIKSKHDMVLCTGYNGMGCIHDVHFAARVEKRTEIRYDARCALHTVSLQDTQSLTDELMFVCSDTSTAVYAASREFSLFQPCSFFRDRTLYAGNLENSSLVVQICPAIVGAFKAIKPVMSWRAKDTIVQGCMCGNYVCLRLENSSVKVLRVRETHSSASFEELSDFVARNGQATCISAFFFRGRPYLFVAFATKVIEMYSLNDRKMVFRTFNSGIAPVLRNSPRFDHAHSPPLKDGYVREALVEEMAPGMLVMALVLNNGELQLYRTLPMTEGISNFVATKLPFTHNKPIPADFARSLVPFYGKPMCIKSELCQAIFVISKNVLVIRLDELLYPRVFEVCVNGPVHAFTAVYSKHYNNGSPVFASATNASATNGRIEISAMDEFFSRSNNISTGCCVRTRFDSLEGTPIKVVHHSYSKSQIVALTCRKIGTLSPISSGKLLLFSRSADDTIDDRFDLDPNEIVTCMRVIDLTPKNVQNQKKYIVVGTSISTTERDLGNGRVLVFDIDNSSGRGRFVLLATIPDLHSPVVTVEALDRNLCVALMSRVHVYEFSDQAHPRNTYDMKIPGEITDFHNIRHKLSIMSLASQGMSLVMWNTQRAAEAQFVSSTPFEGDIVMTQMVFPTSMETSPGIISCDMDGHLTMFAFDRAFKQGQTLKKMAQIRVPYRLSCAVRLDPRDNDPCLCVCSTFEGGVVLLSLGTKAQHDDFEKLKDLCVREMRPVLGLSYEEYRCRRPGPPLHQGFGRGMRDFIDCDMIQAYTELPASTRKELEEKGGTSFTKLVDSLDEPSKCLVMFMNNKKIFAWDK